MRYGHVVIDLMGHFKSCRSGRRRTATIDYVTVNSYGRTPPQCPGPGVLHPLPGGTVQVGVHGHEVDAFAGSSEDVGEEVPACVAWAAEASAGDSLLVCVSVAGTGSQGTAERADPAVTVGPVCVSGVPFDVRGIRPQRAVGGPVPGPPAPGGEGDPCARRGDAGYRGSDRAADPRGRPWGSAASAASPASTSSSHRGLLRSPG